MLIGEKKEETVEIREVYPSYKEMFG